ncbi:MAG: AmmeMemoRadiSam system protein B [Deltaproteobacteria bacterium]|nr:AmmeMemoRadiSam system protein B [Deltaproteobacteria bacterium]
MAPAAEMRPFGPVVAGRFYPGSPSELRGMVDRFIADAKDVPLSGTLLGVVSPHAGYVYSGPAAGWAFRQLKGRKVDIAVVMAPSHSFRGDAAGVLDRASYSTPLGDVKIARDEVAALLKSPAFTSNERLFSGEHSLEVQLPFLRTVLPDTPIVPVVVPTHDSEVINAVAKELHARFGKRAAVYVASSDMSHYKPYGENNKIDRGTFKVMEQMSADALLRGEAQGKVELCGLAPVAVLWKIAEISGGGTMTLLKHENSGDTAGDKSGVVGYGAVAVTIGGKK